MFRFTIRELVLLTLVVAMAVGWWVDHSRAAKVSAAMAQQFGEQTERMNALREENELLGRMVGHMPDR